MTKRIKTLQPTERARFVAEDLFLAELEHVAGPEYCPPGRRHVQQSPCLSRYRSRTSTFVGFSAAFFAGLTPALWANPSFCLVFGFRNKIEVVNRKSSSARHTLQLAYGVQQNGASAFCLCRFG